ncbi:AAA family ATPase [Desulfonema magnum]|uniref:AAA ATPase-like domain-containing protein n=1 Tax=Desulfonema magnum TaxID=45655 RepID=A0A975GKI6_9BACT|nr:ATP-binding protein [Desulfonema magnum]QTA84672.1 AAA ATPase-like domain-containing protein [Desulfonema magnum]
MIDSIYINNFRLFKELTINKLDTVNLIVGKNNSGKSCLLEAIRVYGTNASPKVLFDLIRDRGQDWESNMQQKQNQSVQEAENPLRYLFYGYRFPEIGTNSIEIGSSENIKDRLKLRMRAYKLIETEESRIFTRIDNENLKENGLDDAELVIEIEEGNKVKPVRLNRDPRLYQRTASYRALPDGDMKINIQIVPTKHIDDEKVADLWDNINIHPNLRKEVFEGLKLIDEKIQEVVLVGRRGYINPILIYDDTDERIPLKSMGDGMTHLFHIILALVNSRGGLLLIDEFENGLHYSVQPQIWNLIFQLAKKLEVQVFATTHSWDCVNAFQKMIQQHKLEGMLIHLGHSIKGSDRGKIIATEYDKDELILATQADLEVR